MPKQFNNKRGPELHDALDLKYILPPTILLYIKIKN